jgi:hypothetical protein
MTSWAEKETTFLRNVAQDELASWFLQSFENDSLKPFTYENLSPEAQIQDAFENLGSEDQEKVRAAVVQAIKNWTDNNYTSSTLESIAFVAAYTRASEAITPLVHIIDEKQVTRKDDEDDVPSKIIAVIGGFSPSEEVENTFRRWLNDPEFEWHYSAQLLIGLAICSPEKYPEYLPRFLEITEKHPDVFRLDYCWTEFTSLVGHATIVKHYNELPPQIQESFLKSLKRHTPDIEEVIVDLLNTKTLSRK